MHFARTAETPDGRPASTDHWQPLQEHLRAVYGFIDQIKTSTAGSRSRERVG
jgi:hypothetical protein